LLTHSQLYKRPAESETAARPITESEVKLQWSADERTRQALAAVLVGNEEDTAVTDDCRLVCGHEASNLSRLAGGRRSKIVCYLVEQKVF
jgi:hypothetical protein